jgi:hypothetical protein
MWIDYFLKGKYLPDIDGKNKFLFVFLFLSKTMLKNPKKNLFIMITDPQSTLAQGVHVFPETELSLLNTNTSQ